jgi:transposase-like protein
MDIDLALHWAKRGFRILPLQPNSKKGYHGWPIHATSDPEAIAKLAKRFPKSQGVGFLCDGLLAVDVDGAAGDAVVQDFERRGCHFPETMIFRSPADYFHYKMIYRAPLGIEFKQVCRWKADGINKTEIDLKCWHNLIVAGNSLHQSGLPVITENEMPLSDLPEAPAWLVDLLVAQGHIKTTDELEAGRRAKAKVGWRDGGDNLSAYINMAVEKFHATAGHRHDPTLLLVAKLCCTSLNDSQILDVGKAWLRHYEGQYRSTWAEAVAEFQTILTTTRANPNFVPYRPNILSVVLIPEMLTLLDELEQEEGKPSRILVEVILREWLLDQEKMKPSTFHTALPLGGVERGRQHSESEQGRLFDTPITLTWKQVKDGYETLSSSGIDDHKFSILKSKFFSLPDWGDNGTWAKVRELFIRQTKGTSGKPSVYRPSQWLVQRLSGIEPLGQAKTIRTQGKLTGAEREHACDMIHLLACSDSAYYKSGYYRKFLQTVKERDRYTCQACGTDYNQTSMRAVCVSGVVGRIRDIADYACACRKCAALHGANPAAKWQERIRTLKPFVDRLKNATIYNVDAMKLIRRADRPNVLLYCDPPYYQAEHSYKSAEGFSHEELADALNGLKHASAIVSHYHTEPYVTLYRGWTVQTKESVKSCAGSTMLFNGKHAKVTEALFIKS